MNEHLRERILRRLDALNDERGYQVLDYVEFLESKYAERQTPTSNAFTRFTEAVEDRMRAGRISASAIAETMSLLNRAANVLNGAVAAGKSVATDLVSAAQNATIRSSSLPGGATAASTTTATATTPVSQPATSPVAPKEASSPAHDIKQPGSGEERL
jgi:hypothetical protein